MQKSPVHTRPQAGRTEPASGVTPTAGVEVLALIGPVRNGGPSVAAPIDETPFSIGRHTDSALHVDDSTVSSRHAVIERLGAALIVRDLGSTNGTFVNGRRVADFHPIGDGDLLQFGGTAMKLTSRTSQTTRATVAADVTDDALALAQFGQLMERRDIQMHFQPIVEIGNGRRLAFEALIRSSYTGLRDPAALFAAASHLGSEVVLSQMARMEAMSASRRLPDEVIVFLNTHPREVGSDELIVSLHELRRRWPNRPVVIEIHEAATTDMSRLVDVKRTLTELRMGLAFDDFGAGQSRLRELVEVRPDFVKFDIDMLTGVDDENGPQRPVMRTLVEMVRDLSIIPLAEGIETESQRAFCEQTGFRLAQGFLFGRPMPVRHWVTTDSHEATQ